MTLVQFPPTTEMIRNFLLVLYAVVWSIVAVVTVARGGTISQEQWTALPMGIGALLLALRSGKRRDDDPEDE